MFDFDRLIEDHIAREHRPKQIGRYYPSEVGNCLRKNWYSYKYPLEVDQDKLKIFEVGNMLHGFVVEVMRDERQEDIELLESEFPFKIEMKDFIISGRVDDLILIKSNSKKVLVEVKSTRNVDFIEEPQSHHVAQLMFYMAASNIHNGVILYIDKNDLHSKVFEIPFDEFKSAEIVDRFNFLHDHLTKNNLPLAEAKKVQDMSWMCKFCEYSNKCDKEEK
jgi:CRISPR/Cas system-associated exonuclease Cas4 (RecB family)